MLIVHLVIAGVNGMVHLKNTNKSLYETTFHIEFSGLTLLFNKRIG